MRIFYAVLMIFFTASLFMSCSQKNNIDKKDYKVAYLSNRVSEKRQFDIFVSDTGTTNVENITLNRNDVKSLSSPVFSPDQKYLFYTSFSNDLKFLNVVDFTVDTIYSVTELKVDNSKPVYSSKFNSVYFIDKEGDVNKIFLCGLNGGERKLITETGLNIFDFDLNEERELIVFSARIGNSTSLFTANLDGSDIKQITDNQGDDTHPDFSPDGDKIVFSSSRNKAEDDDKDIYLINSDGSDLKLEFDSDYFDSEPEFSPDGEYIAFLSNRRGMKFRDILLKETGDDEGKNLTMSLGVLHRNFSFSPDGGLIVFEHVQTIDSEIFVVDLKSGRMNNVSEDPGWDTSPTM